MSKTFHTEGERFFKHCKSTDVRMVQPLCYWCLAML